MEVSPPPVPGFRFCCRPWPCGVCVPFRVSRLFSRGCLTTGLSATASPKANFREALFLVSPGNVPGTCTNHPRRRTIKNLFMALFITRHPTGITAYSEPKIRTVFIAVTPVGQSQVADARILPPGPFNHMVFALFRPPGIPVGFSG